MPPRRRPLLLPPQHPQTGTRPAHPPQPPLHLRGSAPGRPLSHPAHHRPGPPAHRRQRHRPPPRRPSPLRPPDRQPKPPQTTNHRRGIRAGRRDHHPPRTGHPRPARRSQQTRRTQKRRRPPAGTHDAKREGTITTRILHPPHPPGHRRRFNPPLQYPRPGGNLVSSMSTALRFTSFNSYWRNPAASGVLACISENT